jgi:hypothetical protein
VLVSPWTKTPCRGPLGEHAAQLLDHPPDLDVARLAADAGQGLRLGEPGTGQEHARKFLVAVLAGVQEPGRLAQNANNGRELNYFRARSNNNCDVTRIDVLQHPALLRTRQVSYVMVTHLHASPPVRRF